MGLLKMAVRRRENKVWEHASPTTDVSQRVDWLHACRMIPEGSGFLPDYGVILLSKDRLIWAPKIGHNYELRLADVIDVMCQPPPWMLMVLVRGIDDHLAPHYWLLDLPGQGVSATPLKTFFMDNLQRQVTAHRPPELSLEF